MKVRLPIRDSARHTGRWWRGRRFSGAGLQLDGETDAYAFAEARREICRNWLPGLMVAIVWCQGTTGRIAPDALAEN